MLKYHIEKIARKLFSVVVLCYVCILPHPSPPIKLLGSELGDGTLQDWPTPGLISYLSYPNKTVPIQCLYKLCQTLWRHFNHDKHFMKILTTSWHKRGYEVVSTVQRSIYRHNSVMKLSMRCLCVTCDYCVQSHTAMDVLLSRIYYWLPWMCETLRLSFLPCTKSSSRQQTWTHICSCFKKPSERISSPVPLKLHKRHTWQKVPLFFPSYIGRIGNILGPVYLHGHSHW